MASRWGGSALGRERSGKTYVAALDFHDLVLTVAVESCPLDGIWILTAPIKIKVLASMCHTEIAALMQMR